MWIRDLVNPGSGMGKKGSEIKSRIRNTDSQLSVISREISKTTRLDEAVDNPEGGSAVRSGGDVAKVPRMPLTFPILR
jgi:hypothetical protein